MSKSTNSLLSVTHTLHIKVKYYVYYRSAVGEKFAQKAESDTIIVTFRRNFPKTCF